MKLFLILQDEKHDEQESDEQIFLVGRHPHCHITLKHPSINRFHLRIHSNPSLRMVSVVDLASGKIRQTLIYLLILHRLFVIEFVLIVNGTWVSGRRIEPGVHVVLKEGDTLKIGSATVYMLHWVDEQVLFLPTVCTTKERDGEPFNADTEVEHSGPCKNEMI
jgi:pSer/pThr/pTyr-binding forkhead associated (FHA) protein